MAWDIDLRRTKLKYIKSKFSGFEHKMDDLVKTESYFAPSCNISLYLGDSIKQKGSSTRMSETELA